MKNTGEKKTVRVINIVMVIIFVMAISLPYIFAARNSEERESLAENRMLAAYPKFVENGYLNFSFPSYFDDWISDNLRGRSTIVKAYSGLQNILFGRITKSDVLLGKDNWTYINSDEMIASYQHTDLMTEEELEEAVGAFGKLSDYLTDKDIKLYYLPCYDKVSIYPEYFPNGVNQKGSLSRTDQFLDRLDAETDINIVYTKEDLLNAKAEYDDTGYGIYYRSYDQNHWNNAGSFIGYKDLMNSIKADNQTENIRILTEDDYDISLYGGHLDIYGYEYPDEELMPDYKIKNSSVADITDTVGERRGYLKPMEYSFEYENPDAGNDLKVLIVNDSFIRMFLADDIAESFSSTLSVHLTNLVRLNEVIDDYDPDMVILENTEMTFTQAVSYLQESTYLE